MDYQIVSTGITTIEPIYNVRSIWDDAIVYTGSFTQCSEWIRNNTVEILINQQYE